MCSSWLFVFFFFFALTLFTSPFTWQFVQPTQTSPLFYCLKLKRGNLKYCTKLCNPHLNFSLGKYLIILLDKNDCSHSLQYQYLWTILFWQQIQSQVVINQRSLLPFIFLMIMSRVKFDLKGDIWYWDYIAFTHHSDKHLNAPNAKLYLQFTFFCKNFSNEDTISTYFWVL